MEFFPLGVSSSLMGFPPFGSVKADMPTDTLLAILLELKLSVVGFFPLRVPHSAAGISLSEPPFNVLLMGFPPLRAQMPYLNLQADEL